MLFSQGASLFAAKRLEMGQVRCDTQGGKQVLEPGAVPTGSNSQSFIHSSWFHLRFSPIPEL